MNHSWVRSLIFASKDQDLLIDLDILCDLDHCGLDLEKSLTFVPQSVKNEIKLFPNLTKGILSQVPTLSAVASCMVDQNNNRHASYRV